MTPQLGRAPARNCAPLSACLLVFASPVWFIAASPGQNRLIRKAAARTARSVRCGAGAHGQPFVRHMHEDRHRCRRPPPILSAP